MIIKNVGAALHDDYYDNYYDDYYDDCYDDYYDDYYDDCYDYYNDCYDDYDDTYDLMIPWLSGWSECLGKTAKHRLNVQILLHCHDFATTKNIKNKW